MTIGNSCVAALITIAALASPGCGGSTSNPPPAFAIDGDWSYLGPSDVPHDLAIASQTSTGATMIYVDSEGHWESRWKITSYDNNLHHFQVTFDSGTGTYLPVGQSMSGTYDLTGSTLTVQLAEGLTSYPPLESAGSCTAATDGAPIPECRVYIKAQN